MAVHWDEGAALCTTHAMPPLQVHQYNPHRSILRENLCATFEAPFMYVLVGSMKVLLIDTGDVLDPNRMPLAKIGRVFDGIRVGESFMHDLFGPTAPRFLARFQMLFAEVVPSRLRPPRHAAYDEVDRAQAVAKRFHTNGKQAANAEIAPADPKSVTSSAT
jgi:hypothetical protein